MPEHKFKPDDLVIRTHNHVYYAPIGYKTNIIKGTKGHCKLAYIDKAGCETGFIEHYWALVEAAPEISTFKPFNYVYS